MIKSGTTVTFYLNGSASFTNTSAPATLTANANPLLLAERLSHSEYFAGMMDEIRIWNTARTQAQIKANMLNKSLSNSASGLVAYYRMNENSGTTTANSCTNTSGINATLVGSPTWAASPVQFGANALSFNGSSNFVSIPDNNSLDITTAITIEAWLYTMSTGTAQNVICKSSQTDNTGYIFPRSDDNWVSVKTYLRIGGSWYTYSVPYPSLNTWHHVALTYDGSYVKIYVDGVLSGSWSQTGTIVTNANPLTIGSQPGYGEYFKGSVDEIRIWNVARTQSQIQTNMNREIDPTAQTGLVSYYTFNQGIVAGTNTGLTNIIDQTGNNNGALNSFTLSGSNSNFVGGNLNLSTLPVSWLSFSAQKQGADVKLNWVTASEQNTSVFVVEHSINVSVWDSIGEVPAAGNSTIEQQYSFLHNSPDYGMNYYRIMLKDEDNRISYSNVASVIYVNQISKISVYPNPASNGMVNVKLQDASTIFIYNSIGELMMSKQLQAGTQQLDLSRLSKGVYQLKAGTETVQVVVR